MRQLQESQPIETLARDDDLGGGFPFLPSQAYSPLTHIFTLLAIDYRLLVVHIQIIETETNEMFTETEWRALKLIAKGIASGQTKKNILWNVRFFDDLEEMAPTVEMLLKKFTVAQFKAAHATLTQ